MKITAQNTSLELDDGLAADFAGMIDLDTFFDGAADVELEFVEEDGQAFTRRLFRDELADECASSHYAHEAMEEIGFSGMSGFDD